MLGGMWSAGRACRLNNGVSQVKGLILVDTSILKGLNGSNTGQNMDDVRMHEEATSQIASPYNPDGIPPCSAPPARCPQKCMLTDIYRPARQPQAHGEPVQHLPLFLHPTVRERLVHDPQQDMWGQGVERRRRSALCRKRRRADRASIDIRRGRREHRVRRLLVEDDHVVRR